MGIFTAPELSLFVKRIERHVDLRKTWVLTIPRTNVMFLVVRGKPRPEPLPETGEPVTFTSPLSKVPPRRPRS